MIAKHTVTKQINSRRKRVAEITIDRPVFINIKDYNDVKPTEKAAVMPFGLLFQRIYTKGQIPSLNDYVKTQQAILLGLEKSAHTMPSAESLSHLKLIADIPLWYARAYANTGNYLIAQYKDYETAKVYFQKALAIDPNMDIAYEGLGDYALSNHDCQTAERDYEKATEINYLSNRMYQKLYSVVDACLHDRAKTQELRDFFSQHADVFGTIETQKK